MSDTKGLANQWIRSLLADWQLIADVAFADLVLWQFDQGKFFATNHARPAAAPTVFYRDLTDQNPRSDWLEIIQASYQTGESVTPSSISDIDGLKTRVSAFPVYAAGKKAGDLPIAVISRHLNLTEGRMPSKVQLNFQAAGNELLEMVAQGLFPNPEAGSGSKRGAARANDGLIRLDQAGNVVFASPNALSLFYRAGVQVELEGKQFSKSVTGALADVGPIDEGLPLILTGKGAWQTDLEFKNMTLAVRSIPAIEYGKRVGATILCRDVTELRFRERELITKDMTIREIHHRVKNNLQTVASLLRIQSRQSKSEEVKTSLAQAMRRVSAIAVVHDVLSEGIDQEVSFDIIFRRILSLVPDITAAYHTSVKTELVGSFGELSAQRSTTLALVLTEVVANAVQHGLAGNSGLIQVEASRDKQFLTIAITDDGVGLAEGKLGTGLGTQIIRTLVESELRGSISWTSPIRGGTKVAIKLPI
jgi:two-component sensor histidine kinase